MNWVIIFGTSCDRMPCVKFQKINEEKRSIVYLFQYGFRRHNRLRRLPQDTPPEYEDCRQKLCSPTLLMNGFAHRIEGIGDKHVPGSIRLQQLRNLDR